MFPENLLVPPPAIGVNPAPLFHPDVADASIFDPIA